MKIQGTLTTYPELRFTPNGSAVASVYFTTPDRGDLRGEAWGTFAESIADANLNAGDTIAILGSQVSRPYTDREGNPKTSRYIRISQLAYRGRDGAVVRLKEERRG